ncbi:MAG: class II SORL domain-containing protein [Spirochaetales bacterium]|nr:class II SORL domain-containing protein [Spirochaetales bacterium]
MNIISEKIGDLYQTADWKKEKHVPVIEGPDTIRKGEKITLSVSVGKEIPHPNKTEHHIRWIELYFHPEGEKFPVQIGKAEFEAHGESPQGPDTSSIYSNPEATFSFRTEKPGILFAASYCNIHGLWQGSKKIDVE